MKYISAIAVAVTLLLWFGCTSSDEETVEIPTDVQSQLDLLFARVAYIDCTADADQVIENVEDEIDDAYIAYLADNGTYAAYERAFDRYDAEFDKYEATMDACWDVYLDSVPE